MKHGLPLVLLVVALSLMAACTALPPLLATRPPATPTAVAPVVRPAGEVTATPIVRLVLPVAPAGQAAAPQETTKSAATPAEAVSRQASPQARALATSQPTTIQPKGQAARQATPATRLIFPVVPGGKATAQPPSDPARPDAKWVVKEQHNFGAYTLTLWHDAASDMPWGDIGTLTAPGQETIQVADASAISDLSGKDITGDGTPDAIIETFTGGAHCCFGVVVYELGKKPAKALDKPASNCGGQFVDVNRDGRYEFVTCDDAFAYAYCPYASSPKVLVIYQYSPGKGYQLASPKFGGQYAADIKRDLLQAKTGKPGDLGEWDNTNKCSVLPLVLDQLYSGRTAQAWQALDQYYRETDKAKFRQEVNATVTASAFYVAP